MQAAVSKKKALYKNWQRSRQPVDRNQYLEAKRAAKQTIAIAKTAHYQDLYTRLDTKEGENAIYQLARACSAATKDIQMVKTIKDTNGILLQRENEIQDCWGEY